MSVLTRIKQRTKKPKNIINIKEHGYAWIHNTSNRIYNGSTLHSPISYSGNTPALKNDLLGGNYLQFVSANSDNVDLGSSPIASTSNLTLMQYLRTTNASNHPISCRSGGSTDGYEFKLSSGNIIFRASTASANQETGSAPINDGLWHLAIGIIDFNEAKLKLIVDGSHISTVALSGSAIVPTQNLIIGSRGATYWDGDSSYVILLPRAIRVQEAINYGINPFSILRPEVQRMTVNTGFGIGSEYDFYSKNYWWGNY